MPTVNCIQCQSEFYKKPAEILRSNKNFCSKKCSGMNRRQPEDAFYARLEPQQDSDCLHWSGAKNDNGYGILSFGGKHVLAHRLAYELAFGPIPVGLSACHSCDNPICCNKDHLFAGTHQENMLDMQKKGRGNGILTTDDVDAIKLGGLSNKTFAFIFGVSERTVRSAKIRPAAPTIPAIPVTKEGA